MKVFVRGKDLILMFLGATSDDDVRKGNCLSLVSKFSGKRSGFYPDIFRYFDIFKGIEYVYYDFTFFFFILIPWSSSAMIIPTAATRLLEIRSLRQFEISDFVRKNSTQIHVSAITFGLFFVFIFHYFFFL